MINVLKASGRKSRWSARVLRRVLIFFILVFILGSKSIAQPLTSKFEGSATEYVQVTVQPGDTLWELALENSNTNPNKTINNIITYNKLKNSYIEPGQVLYIPVRE